MKGGPVCKEDVGVEDVGCTLGSLLASQLPISTVSGVRKLVIIDCLLTAILSRFYHMVSRRTHNLLSPPWPPHSYAYEADPPTANEGLAI